NAGFRSGADWTPTLIEFGIRYQCSYSASAEGPDWMPFHIRRRRAWFLLDVGEQPGLNRGGRALLLRMIAGETAGLEDYGTQLGDVAATRVIKVHERKAGPGHRILQERDRRCTRQAMLAAQMQNSADKAVAAV